MKSFFRTFFVWALLLTGVSGEALAAPAWVDYATVSMTDAVTSKLTANRVCYTDGTDVACDAAAPLIPVSGTLAAGTLSSTNISASTATIASLGIGNMAASGSISATSISVTNLTVGGVAVTGGGGGLGCAVSPTDLSNLVVVSNGGSAAFYSAATVYLPTGCASPSVVETRTCTNGVLSGSYSAATCTAIADACAGGSPTAGTVCADGSVYAGLSPDGNVKMFTTRCDAGQTWNGSTCTGSRSTRLWGTYGTNTGRTNTSTGLANTTYLVTNYSSLNDGYTTGVPAAAYCDSLSENGKTDWYLPAKDELNVLYGARNATNLAGTFDTSGSWYWASTEGSYGNAWGKRFSDGYQSNGSKSSGYVVRCVRR